MLLALDHSAVKSASSLAALAAAALAAFSSAAFFSASALSFLACLSSSDWYETTCHAQVISSIISRIYPNNGVPPILSGTDHDNEIDVSVVSSMSGLPGAVGGKIGSEQRAYSDGSDIGPDPAALTAATRKRYSTPSMTSVRR